MDVKGIIKKYLEGNGYDGLCNLKIGWEGCACFIDDLFPCGIDCCLDCQPGYISETEIEGEKCLGISIIKETENDDNKTGS